MQAGRESLLHLIPLLDYRSLRSLAASEALLSPSERDCLQRHLAQRLEKFGEDSSLLRVIRAIMSQSAAPRTIGECVKTVTLLLFALSGIAFFGKNRFIALLFEGTSTAERAQFASDLLA